MSGFSRDDEDHRLADPADARSNCGVGVVMDLDDAVRPRVGRVYQPLRRGLGYVSLHVSDAIDRPTKSVSLKVLWFTKPK
jgi:hypothetical protein